jgi:hypothetical protein
MLSQLKIWTRLMTKSPAPFIDCRVVIAAVKASLD